MKAKHLRSFIKIIKTPKTVYLFFLALLLFSFSDKKGSDPYIFPDLEHFPKMPVDPENIPTNLGVELGRMLFYDPILSKDSSISCAFCHHQEAAFSNAPMIRSFGVGGQKTRRNSPGLFNLAWGMSMFWDGRAPTIEEQVFHPVRDPKEMALNWSEAEMRINRSSFYPTMFKRVFGTEKADSILISKAIAQFERTLISSNSKLDQAIRGEIRLSEAELEGFILMNDQTKGNCLHCHTTDADVLGTTGEFSNNGLDGDIYDHDTIDRGLGGITGRKSDIGKFKIPSLRNVALTSPYMHDGRFGTLEDVLEFYSSGLKMSSTIDPKMEFVHRGGAQLSKEDQQKIIAFLHTLTDSVFITDPQFSNPFED